MEEDDKVDYDDVLALPSSTLNALACFLEEQSVAQQAFAELSARSYGVRVDDMDATDERELGSELDDDETHSRVNGNNPDLGSELENSVKRSKEKDDLISFKDYKTIFKEDWQLSQFWYTEGESVLFIHETTLNSCDHTDTAHRLTDAILKLSTSTSRIAFVCCPTGYVAYKQRALQTQEVRLFEYDTRFAVLARDDFVHYDLNEPLSFPSTTLKNELFDSQDIVVIDPPFHDEASQRKLATTIKYLLRPEGGSIVLLTGTSLAPHVADIYRDLPKLTRRNFTIMHDGTGSLATPYGCWVGETTPEVDESGFGEFET